MQQGCRAPLGFVQLRDQPDFPLSGLPSPGGLGPEGGRAHSAWNCHPSPPRSAWQLRAPPGLSARIYFLPGQRHFISQEAGWGSSTFSLLSVSALSLGCPPPGPSCPPTGPRHWHGLPGPPAAWPSSSPFGAQPKSAITSTRVSFSLTQGNYCPLHKGGPSCSRGRGERMFTQGHRHHLRAVSSHDRSCTGQTQTSQGPTWQVQKTGTWAPQGHTGGLLLAEMRPEWVQATLSCGFPLRAPGCWLPFPLPLPRVILMANFHHGRYDSHLIDKDY